MLVTGSGSILAIAHLDHYDRHIRGNMEAQLAHHAVAPDSAERVRRWVESITDAR